MLQRMCVCVCLSVTSTYKTRLFLYLIIDGVCLCVCSVYSGYHSFMMNPNEVEPTPAVWLYVISSNKSKYLKLHFII